MFHNSCLTNSYHDLIQDCGICSLNHHPVVINEVWNTVYHAYVESFMRTRCGFLGSQKKWLLLKKLLSEHWNAKQNSPSVVSHCSNNLVYYPNGIIHLWTNITNYRQSGYFWQQFRSYHKYNTRYCNTIFIYPKHRLKSFEFSPL